jgi:hypothetical protein
MKIDVCSVCYKELGFWRDDWKQVCEEHCEDHSYEYDVMRQGKYCEFCDKEQPYDWR